MFKKVNILDEKDKHLRMKNSDVTFPLSKQDKELLTNRRYAWSLI